MQPLTQARLAILLSYLTNTLGATENNESAPWNPANYVGYTTEQIAREVTYTTGGVDDWQGLNEDQIQTVVALMDAA